MQKMGSVKEYLQQIGRLEHRIIRLRDSLDTIRSQMSGVRSPSYDANKVQTSARDDRMLMLISRFEDTEAKLIEAISESIRARAKILDEIDEIEDDNQKQVLYYRYVKHLKWDAIADEMHYTRRRIEQIHGNALQSFRIISEKNTV